MLAPTSAGSQRAARSGSGSRAITGGEARYHTTRQRRAGGLPLPSRRGAGGSRSRRARPPLPASRRRRGPYGPLLELRDQRLVASEVDLKLVEAPEHVHASRLDPLIRAQHFGISILPHY